MEQGDEGKERGSGRGIFFPSPFFRWDCAFLFLFSPLPLFPLWAPFCLAIFLSSPSSFSLSSGPRAHPFFLAFFFFAHFPPVWALHAICAPPPPRGAFRCVTLFLVLSLLLLDRTTTTTRKDDADDDEEEEEEDDDDEMKTWFPEGGRHEKGPKRECVLRGMKSGERCGRPTYPPGTQREPGLCVCFRLPFLTGLPQPIGGALLVTWTWKLFLLRLPAMLHSMLATRDTGARNYFFWGTQGREMLRRGRRKKRLEASNREGAHGPGGGPDKTWWVWDCQKSARKRKEGGAKGDDETTFGLTGSGGRKTKQATNPPTTQFKSRPKKRKERMHTRDKKQERVLVLLVLRRPVGGGRILGKGADTRAL